MMVLFGARGLGGGGVTVSLCLPLPLLSLLVPLPLQAIHHMYHIDTLQLSEN